jgi:hypothetical protein
MDTINPEQFNIALLALLDESFDNVQGYYLDHGTSLFESLSNITALQASISVGGKCATLAAQVKHITFYLDVTLKWQRDGNQETNDWGEIWNTIGAVSPEEWQTIQTELRVSYENIKEYIQFSKGWKDHHELGVMMGVLAHTAYHLGEIRQAMCSLP